MGFVFYSKDLSESLLLHEKWREDGTRDVSAANSDYSGDMPLIMVVYEDNENKLRREVYDYAGAMLNIKKFRKFSGNSEGASGS
jgi:D-Tyr-tRNAtyr deacylase